jgi:nucleoside-diphosphate-sugar epimerase
LKIFLTGATGVMGTSAARALLASGHAVSGLARSEDKAEMLETMGIRPVHASLFDVEELTAAFSGHDIVCNLATHMPAGFGGMRPRAWRLNDRIRTEGSRVVAKAAAAAGVRRLVQESTSLLYADGGDEWLDEQSPLTVTCTTEPAAEAETSAFTFACASRGTVVLRFGSITGGGSDPFTRWRFARARSGQPVGIGDPHGWAHVVHPDDVGTAIEAALTAPGGVYNVGAEPVRRSELSAAFVHAVGKDHAVSLPKTVVRLVGQRLEPLTRSHRVSSQTFCDYTGWQPRYPVFSQAWLSDLMVGA